MFAALSKTLVQSVCDRLTRGDPMRRPRHPIRHGAQLSMIAPESNTEYLQLSASPSCRGRGGWRCPCYYWQVPAMNKPINKVGQKIPRQN